MAGFLLRGWMYRNLVTYKAIGPRQSYTVSDKKLIEYIEKRSIGEKDLDVKGIIKISLSITSDQLVFTADKNDSDPNQLIQSKKAHCVGYSSFFAATCNYLLTQQHLSDTWTATPYVGQLFLLGHNIHTYFSSSFFNNHDFVLIEDKTSGELYAVDPSVHDYLYIDFVSYAK